MTERYRLVFRGEVLEGQHKAVVKQRLGAALKVEGERLDAMFTGKAVTIRKGADTDTAAKFQIAFKRAGARLRVLPIDEEPVVVAPKTAPEPEGAFRLAPVGSPMAEPRPAVPAPAVDISRLSLAPPGTALGTPRPVDAVAPDVSHLTIAAPGVDLGVRTAPAARPVESPAWEIAQAGVDLTTRLSDVEPPVDLGSIDFELAPAGTLLMDADDAPPPTPPDTSHLRLV
jgi:hypothetical protein